MLLQIQDLSAACVYIAVCFSLGMSRIITKREHRLWLYASATFSTGHL